MGLIDKLWDFFVDGGVVGKTINYDHKEHNGRWFGFGDMKGSSKDIEDVTKSLGNSVRNLTSGFTNNHNVLGNEYDE